MNIQEQLVFDVCLTITKQFEGADFDTVTGNFDGCGMSFGILQFNLKSETFKNHILNFCNLISYDYFPVSTLTLQTLTGDQAVSWAKDIMLDITGKPKPEWLKAWKTFLTSQHVINLQKEACGKYFHQAKCLAGRFGFATDDRIAMAFFYDCAVQVWNMNLDPYVIGEDQATNILQMYDVDNMNLWLHMDLTDRQKKLIVIAHRRALKCKPEWRTAFFLRKATIAMGIGIVNGRLFDLKKQIRGY